MVRSSSRYLIHLIKNWVRVDRFLTLFNPICILSDPISIFSKPTQLPRLPNNENTSSLVHVHRDLFFFFHLEGLISTILSLFLPNPVRQVQVELSTYPLEQMLGNKSLQNMSPLFSSFYIFFGFFPFSCYGNPRAFSILIVTYITSIYSLFH